MTEQATDSNLLPLDTSIVLLGSEDPAYGERASAYYRGLGCPVSVLDPDVEGLQQAALVQVLDGIQTPFVVIARDSDFLVADALCNARRWLSEHPGAQGVQGYALGFRPGHGTVSYHRLGETCHERADDGLRARVLSFARSGLQPWRAVMRVDTLRAALAKTPALSDGWLVALSFALLQEGDIHVLEQTQVVSECLAAAADPDALAPVTRALRGADEQEDGCFADEDGFAILRQFVLALGSIGDAPLLFSSPWTSVVGEPVRSFELHQCVEMPYYNAPLFRQLSSLEFLLHAWPVGQAHVRALEGPWVRQRDLLQHHANDNLETLRARYWQALSVNLFAPQVCQLLLETFGEDEAEPRSELSQWLERLLQVGAPELSERLAQTPSGAVLRALAAATPDAAGKQRAIRHLAGCKGTQLALLVLDLKDDDEALQRTFDSVVASGLRDFRLIVLKAGALPAITTPRDTLHFIKVMPDTFVSHLNQTVGQLACEWLMLLQAGDELAGAGLLRLQVELAQASGCKAVCGNEVRRDEEGRLIAIQRPGADFDLLRGRPDLMASHWVLRKDVIMQVGGYSEKFHRALDFDLLLRVVEVNGLAGLAHIDEFLVVGQVDREAMLPDAQATLERHLSVLGYQAQVAQGPEGRLEIEFRHAATPLVSILLAASGDLQRMSVSLASIQQRTRYPRYEVLVVTQGEEQQLAGLGGRVRMVSCPSAQLSRRLELAAAEARGEYLVLMSDSSQVANPGWIEALLNQAQRPEVGVVGCQMYDAEGAISHAGYELLESQQVHASWFGVASAQGGDALGLGVVRACHAVCAEGLMVRKEVFDALGGLAHDDTSGIELCLQVAQAGLLVLMAPHAQLFSLGQAPVSQACLEGLVARWPWAFNRALAVDGAYGIGELAGADGPRWLNELN